MKRRNFMVRLLTDGGFPHLFRAGQVRRGYCLSVVEAPTLISVVHKYRPNSLLLFHCVEEADGFVVPECAIMYELASTEEPEPVETLDKPETTNEKT